MEFYHDKGGVMRGRASFAETTAKNICGRSDWRLRRAEVPGTVKLYPLRSDGKVYGAIISGEHYVITQIKVNLKRWRERRALRTPCC